MFQAASFSQVSFLPVSWKLAGLVPPTPEIIGGHYAEWWRKQRERMKAPTVQDVIELVQEAPAQAVAVVQESAPQALPPVVTLAEVRANAALQRLIAEQLILVAQVQALQAERQADEDDIEALLLLT